MFLISCTVLCLVLGYAVAYPTGAPIETCKIFTANHSGHLPQPSDNIPYQIVLSSSSAAPGDIVTVTLQATTSSQFKGFFVQGRDDKSSPVGQFKKQNDAQTRDCKAPGSADSATHVDDSLKDEIVLQWQAPANFNGKVTFRAIIVQTYEIFWDNIVSSPLIIQ